jgi:hypothetical protein
VRSAAVNPDRYVYKDEINLKVVCNNWRRPDLKAGAYVKAQGVLIVEDDIPMIMADRIRL